MLHSRCFKLAVITSLIKKSSLYSNNLKNYHPVSNLPFSVQNTWKGCVDPTPPPSGPTSIWCTYLDLIQHLLANFGLGHCFQLVPVLPERSPTVCGRCRHHIVCSFEVRNSSRLAPRSLLFPGYIHPLSPTCFDTVWSSFMLITVWHRTDILLQETKLL